jgi:uncharacterized RDD family membrane protein YckC
MTARSKKMPYCKKCGAELSDDADYCPACGTPAKAEASLNFALWLERFVAWFVDILILGAALALARWALGPVWPGYALGPDFLRWIPFLDLGVSNAVHFLYWMVLEGFYGQSFGKMIIRLKVVRLRGERVRVWEATIESVGKAFLLPIDCIVGWILYSKRKQRLFNYLSETVVVRA